MTAENEWTKPFKEANPKNSFSFLQSYRKRDFLTICKNDTNMDEGDITRPYRLEMTG